MKIRRVLLCFMAVSIAVCIGIMIRISQLNIENPREIDINDLLMTIQKKGEDSEIVKQKADSYGLMFYQMDGSYVVMKEIDHELSALKQSLYSIILLLLFSTALLLLLTLCYIQKNLFRPLAKAQYFAKCVAAGNLEQPLAMEKSNVLGAFTESFDIMREELTKAKEKERQADISKKELVASLSHDIKTPLASIKVIAEVLNVTCEDPKQKEKANSIMGKATQIETLVNNLLHSTLEDLQELTVEPMQHLTTELLKLIKTADYQKKIDNYELENAVVLYDEVRLQQVFDNIISNSYKYAGTMITMQSKIINKNLEVKLQDYGSGISEEERLLLTQKYYRGANSKGKSGSGIGLYVADYLMKKMDGELRIVFCEEGFGIIISIPLA